MGAAFFMIYDVPFIYGAFSSFSFTLLSSREGGALFKAVQQF